MTNPSSGRENDVPPRPPPLRKTTDSFLEVAPPSINQASASNSTSSAEGSRHGRRLSTLITHHKRVSKQNSDRGAKHFSPPTSSPADAVFAHHDSEGWLDGGIANDVEMLADKPPRKDKDRESITSRSGRSLRKKTSRLFGGHSAKGQQSNELPTNERRVSASSASTSSSSAISPALNLFHEDDVRNSQSMATLAPSQDQSHSASAAVPLTLAPRHPSVDAHRRRPSRESSDTSFLSIASGSERPGSAATFTSSRGSDDHALHVVREDAESIVRQNGTGPGLSFRMSAWFSNMMPVQQSAAAGPSRQPFASSTTTNTNQPVSSPTRKLPAGATNFLAAAKQKAAGGVRYLLDSEAQPDGCEDPIWVMGVAHSYAEPSSESSSLDQDPSSPPTALHRINSRQSSVSSPPPSGGGGGRFIQLFSSSGNTNGGSGVTFSPSRKDRGERSADQESGSASPSRRGKGKGKEKGRELAQARRWPDGFTDDFRSIVWCTYRAQYAPIAAMPADRLLVSPAQYRQAVVSQGGDGIGPALSSSLQTEESKETPPLGQSYKSGWAWVTGGGEKGLTTDAGWGCMLRTGQSMLANALVHLHLGRDWRRPDTVPLGNSSSDLEAAAGYATYVRILSWFLDDPSALCPFSVHRMALVGKQLGKEIGEWFGPSTAAGALKALTNNFAPCGLAVTVAADGIVYQSEVYQASQQPTSDWKESLDAMPLRRRRRQANGKWGEKGVLVLAGIRLGLDGVNPIYHESLKSIFTFPQSVGIAGGRPSSSYYFVGSQANSLYYLDPHFTRPAVPLRSSTARSALIAGEVDVGKHSWQQDDVDAVVNAYDPSELATFHCEKVKRMTISGMDPSMLLGFLCKNEEDWLDLVRRVDQLPHKIISIQDEPPKWGYDDEDVGMESFSEADFDFEDGNSTTQAVPVGDARPAAVQGSPSHLDDVESPEDVVIAATGLGSPPLGRKARARVSALVLETSTPQAVEPLRDSTELHVPVPGLADSLASLDVSTPTRDVRMRTDSAAHTLRPTEIAVREVGDDDERRAMDDSFHEVVHDEVHEVNPATDETDEWIATGG